MTDMTDTTDTVIGVLVLPPRLSVPALAPPRRLALDPADNHEQYGKECDHRKKVRKVLIGTEKQGGHTDQNKVRAEHRPALPRRRRTPTPAVALGGEPVVLFNWHVAKVSYGKAQLIPDAGRSFRGRGPARIVCQFCAGRLVA